jgi:hypothetical protein
VSQPKPTVNFGALIDSRCPFCKLIAMFLFVIFVV